MRRWMQRVSIQIVAFVTIFLFYFVAFTNPISAAINQQINFQGKLTNPNGTNVTDGTYSIVFSMYTVASGGSAVWTETQGSVAVTDGIFQVALGSVTPLPGSVDFNSSSIYLGIKVGADAEMTPRVRFTAAPYAFNSEKLNGLASSAFGQITANNVYTGTNTIQGTNSSQFVVQNAGTQTLLVADTSAQRVAVGPAAVAANGVLTVGIDTTTASGGLYFGTDSNLYRSAANTLTTDGSLQIKGVTTLGTGTGTSTMQSWSSDTAFWINMPTTGPSGIGTGGPGANAWIGYASGAGNWLTDTVAGDIVYRNTGGKLLFGTTAGLSDMTVSDTNIQIGQSTTDAAAVLLTLDSYNNATDPTGINGATYYNSSLGRFRCYEGGAWKNCITQELATRSFVDTTSDVGVDANTTSYWDVAAQNNNSFPNITPSLTTKSVWVNVSAQLLSNGVADSDFSGRVERSIGATVAACGSGTTIGYFGSFTTNTGARKATSIQMLDSPATTSKVWYNVCSDAASVGVTVNITQINVTLFELDNSNL